jgi:acyl-CoA synthetase (AMP-forming)/AMP-acid ligase II
VAEVAVFGAPDARWGERVVAAIVPRLGATIDPDEVRSFVRASLGGFKAPKEIRVMDALPKSGSGKVLKRELRAMKGEGELSAANGTQGS